MKPRHGLTCKACRSWSPDGAEWLSLIGPEQYGRAISLCSFSCAAEFASERAGLSVAGRHDHSAALGPEVR